MLLTCLHSVATACGDALAAEAAEKEVDDLSAPAPAPPEEVPTTSLPKSGGGGPPLKKKKFDSLADSLADSFGEEDNWFGAQNVAFAQDDHDGASSPGEDLPPWKKDDVEDDDAQFSKQAGDVDYSSASEKPPGGAVVVHDLASLGGENAVLALLDFAFAVAALPKTTPGAVDATGEGILCWRNFVVSVLVEQLFAPLLLRTPDGVGAAVPHPHRTGLRIKVLRTFVGRAFDLFRDPNKQMVPSHFVFHDLARPLSSAYPLMIGRTGTVSAEEVVESGYPLWDESSTFAWTLFMLINNL